MLVSCDLGDKNQDFIHCGCQYPVFLILLVPYMFVSYMRSVGHPFMGHCVTSKMRFFSDTLLSLEVQLIFIES